MARIPALLNRSIKKQLRSTDLVFDYQRTGSEFAFILPGNSVDNTQVLVDKVMGVLRRTVGELRVSSTTLALHQANPEIGPFVQEVLPVYPHAVGARGSRF
jgi:hypothetical protein